MFDDEANVNCLVEFARFAIPESRRTCVFLRIVKSVKGIFSIDSSLALHLACEDFHFPVIRKFYQISYSGKL